VFNFFQKKLRPKSDRLLEAIANVEGHIADRAGLVKISGRGGTSGIGVTTYFDGGLVFDVGTKNDHQPMLPSSVVEKTRSCPLVLAQQKMPEWKVGLCVPLDILPQTEEQEVAFFKRACPITSSASKQALYSVVYGVLASSKEQDFNGFCSSIRSIQRCKWKSLERGLYGEPLVLIERKIYEAGATVVGMSSLGPSLFFLAADVGGVAAKMRATFPFHKWIVSTCNNSGRILKLK
jgi:beta-ribofuranosylaminobenzene 5'-phosphate synthase